MLDNLHVVLVEAPVDAIIWKASVQEGYEVGVDAVVSEF